MWEFMWFIFGLVLGVSGILVYQLARRGAVIRWYEWLIGVIGTILLYIGVWHFFGSLRELETQAGWLGLVIIGVLGLILLVVALQRVWRRNRASAL